MSEIDHTVDPSVWLTPKFHFAVSCHRTDMSFHKAGSPAVTWTLKTTFTVKMTGADLKAGGDEFAIANIEIAREGLEIEKR